GRVAAAVPRSAAGLAVLACVHPLAQELGLGRVDDPVDLQLLLLLEAPDRALGAPAEGTVDARPVAKLVKPRLEDTHVVTVRSLAEGRGAEPPEGGGGCGEHEQRRGGARTEQTPAGAVLH